MHYGDAQVMHYLQEEGCGIKNGVGKKPGEVMSQQIMDENI